MLLVNPTLSRRIVLQQHRDATPDGIRCIIIMTGCMTGNTANVQLYCFVHQREREQQYRVRKKLRNMATQCPEKHTSTHSLQGLSTMTNFAPLIVPQIHQYDELPQLVQGVWS